MLDPDSDIDNAARLVQRRFLLQALVRTVAVIVTSELGRNLAEMLLAKDQHVVQALTAQRADEPLREAVGLLRRQHTVRVNGLRHRVVAGARGLGADRLRLPRGDRPPVR